MDGEFAGFESKWLDRRVEFLVDRANAHAAKKDVRARACAGTLLRDAAAIAFMRGDVQAGREHLGRAGEHFLALGLPHGVLLAMLASNGEQGVDPLALMLKAATEERGSRASVSRQLGPLFATALHQPEQLIALEASAAMAEAAGEGMPPSDERMRGMFHPYRTHPVGMSGVTVAAFLRLMDFARSTDFGDLEAYGNPRLDMVTLFARRGRQLVSAFEDQHHWRLLLSPAALLDFDLIALFAIFWSNGHQPHDMIANMAAELPPMTMVPVKVAETLAPGRWRVQDA